jgi:hypothetical protein
MEVSFEKYEIQISIRDRSCHSTTLTLHNIYYKPICHRV